MAMIECYFVAEKSMDGQPFTVCNTSTYKNIEIAMARELLDEIAFRKEVKRIYSLFHNGQDVSERGISRGELLKLSKKSNGGIYYIPKDCSDFIKVTPLSIGG